MSDSLRTERHDALLLLTIDREERRNALDRATVQALRTALDDAAADEAIRGIVLASVGLRAFCAGQDVKELAGLDAAASLSAGLAGQRLMEELEQHPCPSIAAIDGFCLGGGLELALACDVRIAGRSSVYGLPEVARGLLPTWGGHYRLSRVVGLGRAKAIALFDRRLDTEEALACGLVQEVVEDGESVARALELGHQLAVKSGRRTVATAKMLLTTGFGADLRTARQLDELAEQLQASS